MCSIGVTSVFVVHKKANDSLLTLSLTSTTVTMLPHTGYQRAW